MALNYTNRMLPLFIDNEAAVFVQKGEPCSSVNIHHNRQRGVYNPSPPKKIIQLHLITYLYIFFTNLRGLNTLSRLTNVLNCPHDIRLHLFFKILGS